MKIESSTLALQSTSRAYSRYEKNEQLTVGIARAGQSGNNRSEFTMANTVIQESFSLLGFENFQDHNKDSQLKETADKIANAVNPSTTSNGVEFQPDPENPLKLTVQDRLRILLLLELLGRFEKEL